MTPTETLDNSEYNRVKSLLQLDLDYENLQDEFQNLNRLAASIADTDISLVNLIDSYTQWTVSHFGMGVQQIPREESVCNYTIREEDHLEIARLDKDPRFKDKFFVAGNGSDFNLKYYYGIPLTMESGEKIGALCVLDKDEKEMTPEKIQQLKLIALEIVEHLELKKQLKTLRREVLEGLKIKNKLAHDIRGPLTGILGLSEIALDDELAKIEMRSYFKMIGKSSTQLLDLTKDILNSKNPKKNPGVRKVSIKELGDKIIHLYQPQATYKNIVIKVDISENDQEKSVYLDSLLQIIGNLISNAIKFTPSGGNVILGLSIGISEEIETLEIQVEDSGSGFSAEKIRNILDGKGISSMGTSGEIGFGLGLKLVKSMVEEMGGDFNISAVENSGGRLKMVIPQY
ncbi:GAF domain-containing sensor histidine kinase [Gillisia limnaea]|uniref:histidine kinase n=1 Tax=Gillisia limnaea (strain DSM 15749 / LMG 21470 / R-8282) TaxID=865937 RepID=H2BY18_GILLR|nr:GAF domain-containing sensor histidine kinase [Gillisia limnaea]EHQ03224.1 GAF sensor signal transduction histidine kinase [Gillisia limnaea DSM 15749]